MIYYKLAVIVPHRLCSLALLNVTQGGFQCFPKDTVRGIDDNFQLFMPQAKGDDGQMLSLAFRFLRVKT